MGGYTFTSDVLVPKIIGREVIDIVGFEVPLPFIVVVQGRDDRIAPTDVARDYFEKVKAPAKAFVEIRGGHFAVYTNQQEFLTVLLQRVLPYHSTSQLIGGANLSPPGIRCCSIGLDLGTGRFWRKEEIGSSEYFDRRHIARIAVSDCNRHVPRLIGRHGHRG